ncbi:hypothetical protein P872_07180 [Rhodonellum psychrophilum GCM71 = DSM 17998]|uniref:Uncharacterized protein n=1 Tax=Rhodonellum psychrophilum GCM71 = DSM 17998 TaxID=1123057 RepID=U5C1X3_9BACT|nr:hypothetical protein P872_07180 [Rhodonellum psychrophilum GCM71 = DSM 17998]
MATAVAKKNSSFLFGQPRKNQQDYNRCNETLFDIGILPKANFLRFNPCYALPIQLNPLIDQ